MFDFDKENWAIDLSAVMSGLIASFFKYFFINLDSWVHSLTGVIALLFISFRFFVAIKNYIKDKKNEKNSRKR